MSNSSIIFPPIDQELSTFINIGMPTRYLTSHEVAQIDISIMKLNKYRTEFQKKIEEEKLDMQFSPLNTRTDTQNIACVRNILMDLNTELFTCRQKYYLKIFNYSSQLMGLLNICKQNKLHATCDLNSFKRYAFETQYEASGVENLKIKIKQVTDLHDRLIKESYIYSPQYVKPKTLRYGIDQFVEKCEIKIEYLPETQLDNMLFNYLKSPYNDICFDSVIHDVSNYNYKSFNEALISISRKLQLSTQPQFYSLKSVLLRYVHDLAYPLVSNKFDEFSNHFVSQCMIISSYSPKSLGLSNFLFGESEMTTSLSALHSQLPSIRKISQRLSMIQFLSCPLEILAVVARSLEMMKTVVKEGEASRRLGRFAAMAEGLDGRWELLTFDDCFALFYALLALDPPGNAPAVARVLGMADFGLCANLKYARDIFIAAVKHISEFEAGDAEADYGSEDPLGVL